MHLHRGQRAAIVSADQQGCRQLIADVRRVGQLSQVAFPVGEAQFAPVMNQQGKTRLQFPDATATDRAGRFHQFGHANAFVIQEPPCRLGCGKRRAGARKAGHASRQFGCGSQVRLHHDQVPFLKPRFQRWQGNSLDRVVSIMKPAEVLDHDQRKCFVFTQVNVNLRGMRFSRSTWSSRMTPCATTPSPRVLTSPLPPLCGGPLHCSRSMVTRKLTRELPPLKAPQSLALAHVTKNRELCRYQCCQRTTPGPQVRSGP